MSCAWLARIQISMPPQSSVIEKGQPVALPHGGPTISPNSYANNKYLLEDLLHRRDVACVFRDMNKSLQISSLRKTRHAITLVESETSALSNRDRVDVSSSTASACSVCRVHSSRYSCPRCQILYCSVSCYRKHDNECTEDFYKSRVNSILQLEVKEKSEAMKATLRRFYHNSRENADSHAHEDLCSELRSQTRIPREELLKILSVLEQCENNVDDDSLDQLLLSRFPFLQSKISRLLVSEAEKTQLAEWLVEPWFPWWRTEYCSPKEEVDAEEDELSSCKTTKHLDDRLLRIPPFHTLSPSTTVSTSKVQPSLEYNLVNILYAIVWTLRSFHGAHNAVEQDATAAASVLMQASTVLSQDARFTTLEQVLIECTRFSAQYASSSDTSATCGDFHASYLTSWDVLALDVALLCSNYRYVARAILEARDIIKIAISHSPKDMKDNQTTLHRSRKKLKYYLSWSKEYGEIIVSLSDGIRTWIQDWSSTSHSVLSTNELILPPLQLNTNKNQYKHNQP